jgi:RNA polymerase sigma-70 factor (ECF subfamily)
MAMDESSAGTCERMAPGDCTGSSTWAVTGDLAGPPLDLDSEIEVRFAVLASRYGDMLRRFLQGLSRRPEVAEDLTQQLWLKLLEAARAGRFLPVDDVALRSYLFAAARNLFLDECVRKHGASRTVAHDPAVLETLIGAGAGDGGGTPEDFCHRQQVTTEVRAAMDRLPESQRAVVQMWMAGTSIDSMVAATGACRDTVLSRKKYGMRRLREQLAGLRPGA